MASTTSPRLRRQASLRGAQDGQHSRVDNPSLTGLKAARHSELRPQTPQVSGPWLG